MLSTVVLVIAWLIVAYSVGSFIANEARHWHVPPKKRERYRKVRRYCLCLFVLGVVLLIARQLV
jgi:hypothetical protein